MANVSKYSIRFDQRNPSNTGYMESFVSGSNLILQTDYNGVVTGTSIYSIKVASSSYASVAENIINSPNSVTQSFYNSSTWVFTHDLLSTPVVIQVYDTSYNQIIPQNIILNSDSQATITFPVPTSGVAIAMRSGLTILSGSGGVLTGSTYQITSSWANNSLTASSINFQVATSSFATSSLTASYLPTGIYNITASQASTASVATSINFIPTSASYANSASYAPTNITASWANSASVAISASIAATASYIANLNTTAIISPDTQTSITANNNTISASIAGTQILTFTTQSTVSSQNGSGSFQLNGRLSASNVNVGIPNNNYPWGSTLTGSYFSTWTNDTNVSDILRFFAGAFSASYPIPSPNTKTFSGITGTNTNFGSTVTINGRVPSGSSNAYILYLQPLGWATSGSTIFSGYTFNTGAAYISYASNVGGSTTISSSLGTNAFGLGQLTNGNLTQVNLSGSFKLTFASSSVGTVNYTTTSSTLIGQSTTNLTPSVANPIALNTIPSANVAVIPPVYQDGYFSNFTGSNLTNSISLSNVSSSGIYIFSASIGINSGSSPYVTYVPSVVTYYYTPLADSNFTQTITSPNSSASYSSAITRSLSGAPYLTSGSSYRYVVTSSGAFNPLYFNGTVSTISLPANNLGLNTFNTTSLVTNPTIQSAGVVKSSDYLTTRTIGTYPSESDVIVFDLTINATGSGTTAASSGSLLSTFVISASTNNRAGSATSVGSQTFNVHTAGSFGIPVASGSLLYYGRPDGYVTSSLTFGSGSNANYDPLLDEANRMILDNTLLTMSGSSFNSASYLGTHDLQMKPGFLVNPGGTYGYWYPTGYGTTYKYFIRHYKTTVVVNKLQITITGNTSLVGWDSTTANSVAMAILFESGDLNVYPRCRLYDVSNLGANIISSSVVSSDFTTSGVNPFTASIDLYGNNGAGSSNAGGVIVFPTRAADGAVLDNTVQTQDEMYLLIRYNGSPTPITSVKVEKLS
jgi:hypothetical protein